MYSIIQLRILKLMCLAISNSNVNEVYIVEIKSHLKDEHIDLRINILNKFRDIFLEHKE